MNRDTLHMGMQEAAEGFAVEGELVECKLWGNGHINDTYIMTLRQGGIERRYSLQHMNRTVFTDPVSLMDNILHVTEYLKDQIREQGGDPHRETLDFVRAKTGEPYFVDSLGEYWRAYHFIEDAYALEETSDPQDFYESAVALAIFRRCLQSFRRTV